MYLIDMHCDTLARIMEEQKGNSLFENDLQVNLRGMQEADVLAQFFACFIHRGEQKGKDPWKSGYELAHKMIQRAKTDIEGAKEKIALARSYRDIISNKEVGKISALFTIEEGGIVDGHMERLEKLYAEGIRLMTLLWNYENCMGYPNSTDTKVMEKGLNPFGMLAVERMNELGMIIDVSHMSDGGFWDVVTHSKQSIVASHSNARALVNHPRNLTDDMLKAIGNKGGVAGLNLYPCFVHQSKSAKIEYLVAHIAHMVNVAGIDSVSIGTDFDGFEGGESEIHATGELWKLREALLANGMGASEVEKIWYKNVLRVVKEVCIDS